MKKLIPSILTAGLYGMKSVQFFSLGSLTRGTHDLKILGILVGDDIKFAVVKIGIVLDGLRVGA